MPATRIYLQYEPKLYSDLIQQLFQDIGQEVILSKEEYNQDLVRRSENEKDCNEIVLLSLEDGEFPPGDRPEELLPHAKIIIFSPNGELGYRRLPGEKSWQEIRPFGLAELLYEVLSAGNRKS
jgi:hypothetical protein